MVHGGAHPEMLATAVGRWQLQEARPAQVPRAARPRAAVRRRPAQVQRAAQMRTNQRIRNVVASAADEDLRVVSFAPGETIFRQGDRFVDTSVTLPRPSPGETIFRQGDPSDSFYVLESGEVEMSLVPPLHSVGGEVIYAGEARNHS